MYLEIILRYFYTFYSYWSFFNDTFIDQTIRTYIELVKASERIGTFDVNCIKSLTKESVFYVYLGMLFDMNTNVLFYLKSLGEYTIPF
jgi:hypothetical protein